MWRAHVECSYARGINTRMRDAPGHLTAEAHSFRATGLALPPARMVTTLPEATAKVRSLGIVSATINAVSSGTHPRGHRGQARRAPCRVPKWDVKGRTAVANSHSPFLRTRKGPCRLLAQSGHARVLIEFSRLKLRMSNFEQIVAQ
jgi:hypothetical protein